MSSPRRFWLRPPSELGQSFDARNGGFGGAPKFPQPAALEFLLRQDKRGGGQREAIMVQRTLDRMAGGGIYDQIGGGFHRYAVDAIWLVPHFEKCFTTMLSSPLSILPPTRRTATTGTGRWLKRRLISSRAS